MRLVKKFLALFLTFLFCINFSSNNGLQNKSSSVSNFTLVRTSKLDNKMENVYHAKLRKYYVELYNETIMKGFPLCSYEQFCSMYDTMQLTDSEFIKYILSKSHNAVNDNFILKTASSSEDAKYILLNQNNTIITPNSAFNNNYIPTYYAFDYSHIHEGDVIIEFDDSGSIGTYVGHAAIVYDIDKKMENGNTYIQTIKAVAGGVKFGYLDDSRILEFKVEVYSLPSLLSNEEINDIKYFAERQLGKNYSYDYGSKNLDIDTDSWYCSELVYAAYKYAGADIGELSRAWPTDLKNSSNLKLANVPVLRGLEITNNGGSFACWHIAVTNIGSQPITVNYNTKMCFKNNAKDWKNLSDIKQFSLAGKTKKVVDVYFNFFADAVAFSFMHEEYIYVSYGFLLEAQYSSMVSFNEVIGPNKT